MIKSNKILKFSVFLITFGLLVFHYNLRIILNFNFFVSFFCVFGFLLIAFFFSKFKITRLKKEVFFSFLLCALSFSFMLFSMYLNHNFNIRLLLLVGLPIFIIPIFFDNEDSFAYFLNFFSKCFNIIMLFVFLCGVIDIFYDYQLTKFFTNFYHTEAIFQMRLDEPYRIITFLGHPLITSELTLICFCVNIIREKIYAQKINALFKYVIPIVVISLTGSKTAILLLLFSFLFLNYKNINVRKFLFLTIFLYLLYYFGLFDNIIQRFVSGFSSGDITSGRNSNLIKLLSSGDLQFFLFRGHQDIYTSTYIAALEYPFLRFSYRYGIFFAVLLYSLIFFYPLRKILLSKNKVLLFLFLIIFIDINSFSSICSTSDGMLFYCTFLFILLNASNFLIEKNKKV